MSGQPVISGRPLIMPTLSPAMPTSLDTSSPHTLLGLQCTQRRGTKIQHRRDQRQHSDHRLNDPPTHPLPYLQGALRYLRPPTDTPDRALTPQSRPRPLRAST